MQGKSGIEKRKKFWLGVLLLFFALVSIFSPIFLLYVIIPITFFITIIYLLIRIIEGKIFDKSNWGFILPVIFITFTYILPFLVFFVAPIGLVYIITKIFRWVHLDKAKKVMLIVFSFLLIFRISGLIIGILSVNSVPPPRSVNELYQRLGPLQISCWGDFNMLCRKLRVYVERAQALVRTAAKDKKVTDEIKMDSALSGSVSKYKDPYRKEGGLSWIKKQSGIFIYSIGPDKIDNKAELIYDPTNGSFSDGDIVKQID